MNKEELLMEKECLLGLMVDSAKYFPAIIKSIDEPDNPDYNFGRELHHNLLQKLSSLPDEFYSKQVVSEVMNKYYKSVVDLSECRRKPNEPLRNYVLRAKKHDSELGKVGGFYDGVDSVACLLIGTACKRNRDISPTFFGLSHEEPITIYGKDDR